MRPAPSGGHQAEIWQKDKVFFLASRCAIFRSGVAACVTGAVCRAPSRERAVQFRSVHEGKNCF